MICDWCGESTHLENDEDTVWNANGDQAAHSYCAHPCSTCGNLANTELPDGTWACAECEPVKRCSTCGKAVTAQHTC